jgi:putative addiction module CopG family antidote
MDVHLTAQSEKFVNEQLAQGAFRSPEEVIERALEVLRSENEWLHDHRDLIRDKIERAFDQFENGEFFSAEESRADMEQRKNAWLSEHKR